VAILENSTISRVKRRRCSTKLENGCASGVGEEKTGRRRGGDALAMIGFPALAHKATAHKGFPGAPIVRPAFNPSVAVAVGPAEHVELSGGQSETGRKGSPSWQRTALAAQDSSQSGLSRPALFLALLPQALQTQI
jgi:hypothetical protein